MLRITISDSAAGQKLKVEGKLTEPWVSELESAWTQARQAGRDSRIEVDLSDMTFIDPKGEAVLMAMIADGARLTAKGIYCEYVAEQLTSRALKAQTRRERRNGAGARDSVQQTLYGHSSERAASVDALAGQVAADASGGPESEL